MTGIVNNPPPRLTVSPATEAHLHLRNLESLLGAYSYRYGSEVQLHATLAQVLVEAGIECVREFQLDQHSRADFWLPMDDGGLVIEVKVCGSIGDAVRQVVRYAGFEQVRGVLLASSCRWALKDQWVLAARRAPLTLAGKPAAIVHLQRQAL